MRGITVALVEGKLLEHVIKQQCVLRGKNLLAVHAASCILLSRVLDASKKHQEEGRGTDAQMET